MTSIVRPDPYIIHYHFDSGSMPPLYHYEYTIRIGPGPENKIIYLPGYPGEKTPCWEYTFTVGEAVLHKLYEHMLEKRVMLRDWQKAADQPVGGSLEWAEITINRILVKIPANLPAKEAETIASVYQAVKDLVPEEIWTDLDKRQKQQEEENRG